MIVHPLSTMAERLPELVDQVARDRVRIGCERDGRVEAVLLSASELRGMQATIDLLSNPEATAAVARGRRDLDEGRFLDADGIEALRAEAAARSAVGSRDGSA